MGSRRRLLAEQDLAAGADVLACLGSTLVGASLQTDDGLASLELLLAEVTLALIGGLGAQEGTLEVVVLVGLQAGGNQSVNHTINHSFKCSTYSTAQSEDGVGDVGNVLLLVEIDGLEDIDIGHTVFLESLLEVVDVLHELELATRRVDLGHRVGGEGVDQLAQHLAVLEHILVCLAGGEFLANDGLNPFLGLLVHLGIAFAGNLHKDFKTNKNQFSFTSSTLFPIAFAFEFHII